MTGISDVVRSAKSFSRSFLARKWVLFVLSHAWPSLVEHLTGAQRAGSIGLDSMPTPKTSVFEEPAESHEPSLLLTPARDEDADEGERGKERTLWGLLVPVCCRSSEDGAAEGCFSLLQEFSQSLEETTSIEDRREIVVILGIDAFDIFYDCDATKQRVVHLFESISVHSVHVEVLRSHYRGKLCRIWDYLALKAMDAGCSFVVLLGDDVRLVSEGWKREIEDRFSSICASRGLPPGAACVAFRDLTFPVFPTFPVIHRRHFEVFGCLFSVEFVNQHGDPFLFELYRRLGASEFAPSACLRNTIGGREETSRYAKHSVPWHGDVLSSAVSTLCRHLGKPPIGTVSCLDLVVPSYRCDMNTLQRITTLTTTSTASIQMLVVVDNPSVSMTQLRQLEDWTPNHLVRVTQNVTNMGASLSQNTGLASSHGDWVVLLDDDVAPDDTLLDAFLSAVQRHPDAKILVGLTSLPSPTTLIEHALIASQMTFFYNVSLRMKNPPWGVTANLCVRGRASHGVWFSTIYPRTGGGEDVDYCMRIKDLHPYHQRHEVVAAVPEARVQHPFWPNITRQVIGWALGDVKCLGALPLKSFYSPPNWIEFLLLLALFHILTSSGHGLAFVAVAIEVCIIEITLTAIVAYPNTPECGSLLGKLSIATTAAYLPMVQDIARLTSKLSRMQFSHICRQFDWMDGQRDHVVATRFAQLVKGAFFLMCAILTSFHKTAFQNGGLLVLVAVTWVSFLMLWSEMVRFSPAVDQQHLRATLAPLPVDFPAGTPQPFVILAFQCTGSNLLCGKLHNHYQVVMHNEIFNIAKIWTYQNEDVLSDATWCWDIFSRNRDPIAFLVDVFKRKPLKKLQWKVVGFKMFPDHWTSENEEALQRVLADRRIKKIILRRNDYLAVYASKLRADKTGKYINKSLDEVKIRINLSAFESFIEYYNACYEYYDAFVQGQDVHRVTYEELVAEGPAAEEAIRKVLEFLQVDSSCVPEALSVTKRQTLQPLCEGIVNYNQVNEAFKHHPKLMRRFW